MAYMPLRKEELYLETGKMTKIWDLSQPWGWDTPLWPFPGARSDLNFPRGQYLERFHKRTCTYTGTLHAGTHMDAPNHTLHEEEVDRERYGYTLAELPLEHCVGTGVILDMTWMYDEFQEKFNAAEGDPARMGEIWRIITPEDVDRACEKDGLEIRENDWVVIDTGFHRFWRINNDKYFNYYPGLGPEVCKYLMFEKKIKGISGTWGATDSPLWHYPVKEQMPWLATNYKLATGRDIDVDYPDYEPCHRLFAQHGVMTVENAGGDIDEVKGKRMIIAAFPFRCEAADGGFVRLVAWEEGSF
ncbi:MAG: cyclase family protein [Oscillospiraceae bacterium]|nr:cyclase family protein [Oscillospiraceae bacterium]